MAKAKKLSASNLYVLQKYATHFLYYDPARGSFLWANRIDGEDSCRADQRAAQFCVTNKLIETGYMRKTTQKGINAMNSGTL